MIPLPPSNKAEWVSRARILKTQTGLATSLFPMLDRDYRAPMRQTAGETADYTLERVAIESLAGLFVTGSLWLPKKNGKRPAMLQAHGHFQEGRLNKADLIRAETLARSGYIVFAWDMVGYNDCDQIPHNWEASDLQKLYGFSQMALQTLHSRRALDFVLSLPNVDPKRVGMSGISGGGTQTFILAAIEERLSLSVPVKMVSAHMQGGCICENAPSLRTFAGNGEIAALAAPRPMLLISDTGDWTKDNPKEIVPMARAVYRTLGAEANFAHAHCDEGHQFGPPARAAYYQFLTKQFGPPDQPFIDKEPEFELSAYRVWKDDFRRPAGVSSVDQAFEQWKMEAARANIRAREQPNAGRDGRAAFRALVGAGVGASMHKEGRRIIVVADDRPGAPVLICEREPGGALAERMALAIGGMRPRNAAIYRVLEFHAPPVQPSKYYDAYNWTPAAHKARAVHAVLRFLSAEHGDREVGVLAEGEDAVCALIGAVGFERLLPSRFVGVGNGSPEELVKRCNIPHLMRLGGFDTAQRIAPVTLIP